MKILKASSLRMRLLAGLMLAILGFWGAWFGCQAMLMSSQQTTRWDASMQAVGQQILVSMPAVLPSGSSEPVYQLPGAIHQQPELLSFQVWLRNGRSVLRSGNSPATPFVPLQFDKAEAFHGVTHHETEWRIYTLNDASGQLQVQVGKSQPQLLSMIKMWLGYSVGTIVLLMALLCAVTWVIICWSLSPVEAARSAMLQRGPLDLTPLEVEDMPSEVKPLVDSFNALLVRLEAALQGERRFLADAAHEMRTPLAALMAQAQLVQSATTLEESRRSLAPLVAGIERTARLTEQLLDLARLDALDSGMPHAPVSLHEIVSLVVRDYDNTAHAACQRLQLHAEPCQAHLDVNSVGVLLRNLLDNALRYAGEGARVVVICREQVLEDGLRRVVLSVCDDGPGVPVADRQRILDRFYRVPGTPGRGSGIGLSLVARIAQLHGARLEVSEGLDGRGLGVTLHMPPAGGPAPVAGTDTATPSAAGQPPVRPASSSVA